MNTISVGINKSTEFDTSISYKDFDSRNICALRHSSVCEFGLIDKYSKYVTVYSKITKESYLVFPKKMLGCSTM